MVFENIDKSGRIILISKRYHGDSLLRKRSVHRDAFGYPFHLHEHDHPAGDGFFSTGRFEGLKAEAEDIILAHRG